MPAWIIYHNPGCSKSRQTLELLRQSDIEPEIIEYLNTPPGKDELMGLLKKLGLAASDLLRKKEKILKELDLDLSDESALIEAMTAHPILIERPIVVKGEKAVLGRPPENVRQLMS